MLFPTFVVATAVVSAPLWGSSGKSNNNHHSHTTHTTTTNSKWRPWSGTTTTQTSTLSHQSGAHPVTHPVAHQQPVHEVSHVPLSSAVAPSSGSGFNWGHAAVGAGAGIAGATLWNQQSQINDLKEQNAAAHNAAAPMAAVAQPMAMPVSAQPAVAAAPMAPVNENESSASSSAPIHSQMGQEIILPTDDGLKIFLQKN